MLRFLAGLIIGRCRPKTHKRAACFDALLAFTSLPKGQRVGQAIMFQLGHYCRAIANRILKVLLGLASSAGSSMCATCQKKRAMDAAVTCRRRCVNFFYTLSYRQCRASPAARTAGDAAWVRCRMPCRRPGYSSGGGPGSGGPGHTASWCGGRRAGPRSGHRAGRLRHPAWL